MEENKNRNRIGQDFTLMQLLAFAAPAILQSLFSQLFKSLDDGLFVSRYVGEHALASISLLGPANAVIMGFSNLFAIGASTLSAQKMGEGKQEEAQRIFTRVVLIAAVVGFLIALVMNVFCDPILLFLGADETLIENSRTYVRIVLSVTPFNLMGFAFGSYYSTTGHPEMGLVCSVTNGVLNILLDVVLIAVLRLGVLGSSLSTAIGEMAVFFIGFFFFIRKKNEIHFTDPKGEFIDTAVRSAKSGFSQFINSVSIGATSLVTNRTLLSLAGADGVAANAIIGELRIILTAGFFGYATCVGPVIAYNYGNRNPRRLKRILTNNLKIWFFGTIVITIIGEILRVPMLSLFFHEGYSQNVYDMAYQGLTIEFISSMFTAGCVLIMRMFVALGNPKVASILTTLRNFVFRLAMLVLLPLIFGTTGVWLAFPAAELISFILGAVLVYLNRDNYGYGKSGMAYMMQPRPGDYIPYSEEN
ncbi:MAG: hypothetical protein IJ091_07230 [Oscillospiraceae bacterium]|nr:hypothetical protein [Oscillospiraceae bacterium]